MNWKKDKLLMHFVKKTKKKLPDAKIILFGSRAGKDFLEDSDYDIMVVSSFFENSWFPQRGSELLPFWKSEKNIDILCYTPKEFKERTT